METSVATYARFGRGAADRSLLEAGDGLQYWSGRVDQLRIKKHQGLPNWFVVFSSDISVQAIVATDPRDARAW